MLIEVAVVVFVRVDVEVLTNVEVLVLVAVLITVEKSVTGVAIVCVTELVSVFVLVDMSVTRVVKVEAIAVPPTKEIKQTAISEAPIITVRGILMALLSFLLYLSENR